MDYDKIAEYYDNYVNFDVDIPFFIRESAQTRGNVLELMSGTGRLSVPLIESGVNLTCVDSSQPMLQILQDKLNRKGLTASIYQQDISELCLTKQYDLIIIPFHSFAELADTSAQIKALNRIYQLVADGGTFICTLHNPLIRLKTVTGQLRLLGKYPLREEKTLLVWSSESYNPLTGIVNGVQLYEEYDIQGIMRSRMMLEVRFCLLKKVQFENLAQSAGFRISEIYGDYSLSKFNEESSPVMVFKMHK